MTSAINPNNINGAYPVAGQDNNSQGFRDNFTNTGTNFQFAANEITDLQNKVIVSAQLTGGSSLAVQNDMLNSPLLNALVSDFAAATAVLGTLSGTVSIDYTTGHYQTVTAGAPISLNFSNFPIAGQMGLVTVQITINNPNYTVTFPAAVSVNTTGVQGLNPSTNIITFAATGIYTFTFVTSDGGTTITLSQANQLLTPFTATLADGVDGQIKVFTQTFAGSMAVTVATPGWGGAGTITLAAKGQGCTLQYTDSAWYCVGNNGTVFA